MKLNFKVAFAKEKIDLPLLREVFSKGSFKKPAPGVLMQISIILKNLGRPHCD